MPATWLSVAAAPLLEEISPEAVKRTDEATASSPWDDEAKPAKTITMRVAQATPATNALNARMSLLLAHWVTNRVRAVAGSPQTERASGVFRSRLDHVRGRDNPSWRTGNGRWP